MRESIQYKKGFTKIRLAVAALFVALILVGTLPSFAFADTADTPVELIYEEAPAPGPGTNPQPNPSPDPAESGKTGKGPLTKTGDEGTLQFAALLFTGAALACFCVVYASTKNRKEDQ